MYALNPSRLWKIKYFNQVLQRFFVTVFLAIQYMIETVLLFHYIRTYALVSQGAAARARAREEKRDLL